jgi:hypothetical protein
LRFGTLMRGVLSGVALLVTSLSCGGSNGPVAPDASQSPSPSTTPAVVPTPVAPLAGASVANACSGDTWQFDWSDIQASAYHLQVFSPSGSTVLDVSDIPASIYTWSDPPTVEESARRGWRWRVQALVAGSWWDWTTEISFDVDPLAPRLLSPSAGAVMDNGCMDGRDGIAWDFHWSECRGADRYHLFVMGARATIPLIDDDRLAAAAYEYRAPGWIAPGNDRGWTWRLRARIGGEWRDWSANGTFDAEAVDTDCAALAAPQQIAPPDGAVFNHFPRTTVLEWAPVPQAASYSLDRESCPNPACVEGQTNAYPPVAGLTGTRYTFDFVGAQPGRWRVWAVNGAGVPGAKSGWRGFRFTR